MFSLNQKVKLPKLNKLEERWVRENARAMLAELVELEARDAELKDKKQGKRIRAEREEIEGKLSEIKDAFSDLDLLYLCAEPMISRVEVLYDYARSAIDEAWNLEAPVVCQNPDKYNVEAIVKYQIGNKLRKSVLFELEQCGSDDKVKRAIVLAQALIELYNQHKREMGSVFNNSASGNLFNEAESEMWDRIGFRVEQLILNYKALLAWDLMSE